MDTTAIRQKLHSYLEVANDKKVKAIYTMVEDAIEESAVEYNDEFKAELDRRQASYRDGTEKVFTESESKKRIKKLLKAKSK